MQPFKIVLAGYQGLDFGEKVKLHLLKLGCCVLHPLPEMTPSEKLISYYNDVMMAMSNSIKGLFLIYHQKFIKDLSKLLCVTLSVIRSYENCQIQAFI